MMRRNMPAYPPAWRERRRSMEYQPPCLAVIETPNPARTPAT
jgi:hypothetical protein